MQDKKEKQMGGKPKAAETNYREWLDWIQSNLYTRVPCGIAVIGPDYTIMDNNANQVEIFGDGKGKRCYEVFKRRSEPCETCPAMMAFKDGCSHVNEEHGYDKFGCEAFYIVNAMPVVGDDGKVPYVIEICTDITEVTQKQREYRTLFERVPCLVWVMNKDKRIIRANEQFRERFGEAQGKHCYEALLKRPEPCEDCPATQTFDDGGIHQRRQSCIMEDGEPARYHVSSSPISMSDPSRPYVVMMANDITEEEQLREDLAEANIFREIMVENSIDAIVGTDPRGRITLINPAAEKLLGYRAHEVIMREPPEGMFPKEFYDAAKQGRERCLLEETSVKDSRGDSIPVRFAGVAINRRGVNMGYAAFILDLRRIKELESQMIEAERMAAVGQTVSGLAHSIKNILSGLEGGVYLFETGMKKDEAKRRDQGWEMIERNLSLIKSMTGQLLDFSRGRKKRIEKADPTEIVREVAELFEAGATSSDIDIVVEENSAAPANLDKREMHTAITNLVSNAIDACKAGGKTPCRITISCEDREGDLVFEVADQGIGMDEETVEKVTTQPFVTSKQEGTGLGLFLTRSIATQHGGFMEAESELGSGTAIRLVFPRDRLPELTDEGEQMDALAAGGRKE